MLKEQRFLPVGFKTMLSRTFVPTSRLAANLRCVALSLALALSSITVWAEAKAAKPDPTGTWKWTFTTAAGQAFERSVSLKQEGEKLSGFSTWPGGVQVAIADGKFKADEISFTLTREQQGAKYVSKYQGKVSGDTIKGKIESDLGGEKKSFDWDAQRVKEKK